MSFSMDCFKCFSYSILLLILLAIGIGISITSIVLGATNINSNCTGYSEIPAYLITSGVLGIIAFLVRFSDNLEKRESNNENNDKKKEDSCFLQLLYLGQFGVLIWGSVILFGKHRPSCDTELFDYALAITLMVYAVLALYFLFYCSACCYALYNSVEKSHKNKDVSLKDVVIEMNHSNA